MARTVASPNVVEPTPARCGNDASGQALRNTAEWSDSLRAHVRELIRQRELLYTLTLREIKVRYKQTALGALWAILQPLALMAVLTLFLSFFVGVPSDDLPYPLFSYAGLLPWTFLATALSFATPSLIGQVHIITRVYFPREIVPLACVLAALVDFAVAAVVFAGLLAYYRIAPTWNALYAVPLLAVQVIFVAALCLLFSAATAIYRDVRFTLPLLLQVWMFATPILYPVASVPEPFRGLYMGLNPMAVIVDGYRRAILQGESPELRYLATAALASLLLLYLGYRWFKRLERVFADVI